MAVLRSYLPAHGYLVRTDQSVVELSKYLWTRGQALGFENRLLDPKLRAVPVRLLKGYRVLRLNVSLLVHHVRPRVVPVHIAGTGHVVLPLRFGGYKVFDLERAKVLTLFSPELGIGAVERLIGNAREAGQHDFAPTVLSFGDRCYEESYLNGRYPEPLNVDGGALERHFLPLLKAFISATPPRTVELNSYVSQLCEVMLGAELGLDNPSVEASSDAQRIRVFVEKLREDLRRAGTPTISLVLSHGDVHERNVLLTPTGAVAIDWANLAYRSVFFDLYTLLFRTFRPVRPFWSFHTLLDDQEVTARLQRALEQLQAALAHCRSGLADGTLTGGAEETYRGLFYLEFIYKGIQKLWDSSDPTSLRERLRYTCSWVHKFEDHEAYRTGAS